MILKAISFFLFFFLALVSCSVNGGAAASNPPILLAGTYQQKIAETDGQRIALAAEYRVAGSPAAKKATIEKAREKFVSAIDKDIFPFWYGTEWDFYGTTQIPNEGKIACGYFVTTVLRDAGAKVSRISLAQQASENIIKSLTTAPYINRYHNASIEKFVEGIKTNGEGLYIVGLDFHVGFILNDGGEVYFIHSSYAEPAKVMKEKALESEVLASSKYRVTEKISQDDAFIIKWLSSTQIPTIRR